MEKNRKPRGLRNCNPLNIRKTNQLFQGLADEQDDPDFFRFRTMGWGYRAAFVILRTYAHKYGIKTIREIIGRWAPPEDHNDTGIYIRMVCCLSGLEADQVLNPYDGKVMIPLVAAMSRVENGLPAIMAEVKEGWRLYMG